MENRVVLEENGQTILSLHDESNYYQIIWDKFTTVDEIVIEEGKHIALLEIGDPKKPVHYRVEKNAALTLAIASLESAESNERKMLVLDNAQAMVACADFSEGKKHEDFSFEIQKEGASVLFHLATLSSENDDKEFSVSFIHQAAHTMATMNNYGVCEGNSRLIFSGIGHILHGAKHAETHQNAKIMVFDPHCQAFASPILKIDENDIAASHACSVGRVNDEHLFYLTSRGLKEEEAKQLITLGYLKPILAYFKENEQELISSCMERRMK